MRALWYAFLLALLVVPGLMMAYSLVFAPPLHVTIAGGNPGEILQDRNGVPTWVKP
jgi:hypothetical protein